MPPSITITPGLCWFGITDDYPPAYKLGVFTVRCFAEGLDTHLHAVVNAERVEAQKRHMETLQQQKQTIAELREEIAAKDADLEDLRERLSLAERMLRTVGFQSR